jgi:hypothetical protein
VIYALRAGAYRWWDDRLTFAIVAQVIVAGFFVVWPIFLLLTLRRMRVLRSSERRKHPESFQDARDQVGSSANEYRSRWKLFGVPLVHIRFSTPDEGERPVFGWFAGGDRAYGLLFAWGAFAVAPVSVGAVSCGILTVGCVGLGVISLGTVSVGVFALGCATMGVDAYAWLSALGWDTAASGGFALAQHAAAAPVAFAQHANDQTAMDLLVNPASHNIHMLALAVMAVMTLVPVILYARAVRQRLGRR